MYHVVASDMDGTLLLPNHTLSPFTRETLQLITQQGVHFVFATGRHYVDIAQIRDSLGIQAFMITSNGARVHNPEGELLFSHNMASDITTDLVGICFDDPKVTTHIYRDDEWYASRECPDESDFYQESIFHYQLYRPERVAKDRIGKIFFTCEDYDHLLLLEAEINARWGTRVNASFSLPSCLEVMSGEVSKGHALAEVSKLLGYTLQDCVAFGDGMNDKEMLAQAGKGCLMRNASPRLKALLPDLDVIGSNADDAVAHYLRGLYL